MHRFPPVLTHDITHCQFAVHLPQGTFSPPSLPTITLHSLPTIHSHSLPTALHSLPQPLLITGLSTHCQLPHSSFTVRSIIAHVQSASLVTDLITSSCPHYDPSSLLQYSPLRGAHAITMALRIAMDDSLLHCLLKPHMRLICVTITQFLTFPSFLADLAVLTASYVMLPTRFICTFQAFPVAAPGPSFRLAFHVQVRLSFGALLAAGRHHVTRCRTGSSPLARARTGSASAFGVAPPVRRSVFHVFDAFTP
ncbi:hypothetical protein AVEN_98789-1 [Araneus ventricosus]|uniref:Uncharacterized protein n=1 Tax=Araneus ventricosus TaxID=182803 RepID=A0A4Y2I760_ARAVE|nr:hypothetical protein AVEN_98789-1 [Araneus ventricosus]